jgi:hypothetical protein
LHLGSLCIIRGIFILNGYELSRNWFDWCFENPEKINPNHTAIYFFAIEHCNRMGWKNKFGFPSQMTMDALGIKKHQTYIKYFRDLVDWGFIILIQESKNQYSANIISLNNAMLKNGKALDKALIKHTAKQTESNGQSNSSIDKQTNNITINKETDISFYKVAGHLKLTFEDFAKLKQFGYTDTEIILKLEAIENSTKNKNYKSYFLTAKNWLIKDYGIRKVSQNTEIILDF